MRIVGLSISVVQLCLDFPRPCVIARIVSGFHSAAPTDARPRRLEFGIYLTSKCVRHFSNGNMDGFWEFLIQKREKIFANFSKKKDTQLNIGGEQKKQKSERTEHGGSNMKNSKEGIALIKKFEGLEPKLLPKLCIIS